MSSRRSFCLTLIGYLPVIAWADLYDDYINSTSNRPFVSFQGRKGSVSTVGHAFVGVGVQLNATLRIYERFFGLYPDGDTLEALKSVFSPTSGRLDQTWSDITWDTELVKWVDDTQRKQVLTTFDDWSSSAPEYSLLGNGGLNCNGLLAEVATSVGLLVPDGAGTTRPWKFIEAIKSLN